MLLMWYNTYVGHKVFASSACCAQYRDVMARFSTNIWGVLWSSFVPTIADQDKHFGTLQTLMSQAALAFIYLSHAEL